MTNETDLAKEIPQDRKLHEINVSFLDQSVYEVQQLMGIELIYITVAQVYWGEGRERGGGGGLRVYTFASVTLKNTLIQNSITSARKKVPTRRSVSEGI